MMDEQLARVAVIIPCFNEAAAIGKVVRDFKRALPDASIFVYDNNSMDETVAAAREAGAIVRNERLQGKGNVVRRMFADVDADVYVMVDGDATYDAPSASTMVRLLLDEQLADARGVMKIVLHQKCPRVHLRLLLDADPESPQFRPARLEIDLCLLDHSQDQLPTKPIAPTIFCNG